MKIGLVRTLFFDIYYVVKWSMCALWEKAEMMDAIPGHLNSFFFVHLDSWL